jgi:hypothetical protein
MLCSLAERASHNSFPIHPDRLKNVRPVHLRGEEQLDNTCKESIRFTTPPVPPKNPIVI